MRPVRLTWAGMLFRIVFKRPKTLEFLQFKILHCVWMCGVPGEMLV